LLRATERKPAASLVEYGMYPSPFARPPTWQRQKESWIVSPMGESVFIENRLGPLRFPFASHPNEELQKETMSLETELPLCFTLITFLFYSLR